MTNSFGIYAHIPFCYHRCSYCDFFSSTQYSESEFSKLFVALNAEWQSARDWLVEKGQLPRRLRSIFFGGGTPSLAPDHELRRFAENLLSSFGGVEEFTLEANPETVTREKVASWKAMGVNRVSLGAQSFQPELLKVLERQASPEAVRRAFALVREGGIERVNLDLIFGIPGQGQKGMCGDIDEATALGPSHISFYSLTLKPGHPLYKQLPSDDDAAELFELGHGRLAERGYLQYEISNFCRPNEESQHNLLYWDGGDFLGVGPSAATRFFWDGRFHHRKQVSDLKKYFENPAFPGTGLESTSHAQTVLEAAFLELRKNRGVSVSSFRDRYDYDLSTAKKVPDFARLGLLEHSGDHLRLTAKGLLLADSVTRDIVDL